MNCLQRCMPCLRLRDAEPPHPPDERCFAAWSPDEVSEWVRHKFAEDSRRLAHDYWAGDRAARAADDMYLPSLGTTLRGLAAADALRKHLVDGRSLGHLTLDRMVAIGVPFGVAVSLSGYVDELGVSARGDARGGGGAELPGWYRDMSSYTDAAGADRGDIEGDDVEPAQSNENAAANPDDGRAQRVMKERFGLELPAIRGRDAAEVLYRGRNSAPSGGLGGTSAEGISTPTTEHLEASPLATAGSTSESSSISLDNVLSGMPEHIRDIARRRPDLLSKVLREKQHQHQPRNQLMERDSWSGSRVQTPTIDEEVDEENEGAYDSGREDGAEERVGLLRRRK